MDPIQNMLMEAVRAHQAGRLPEAERGYRLVLRQVPDHPDALHLLGVLALQTGNPAVAVDLIRKAVARHGSVPDYHINLGNALAACQRRSEAIRCYRHALKLAPQSPEAANGLGSLLLEDGQAQAALDALDRGLAGRPDYPQALANKAEALRRMGQLTAAWDAVSRAVSLLPNFAEGRYTAGLVALDQGDRSAAEEHLRQAVTLRPVFPEAWASLADVLRRLRRPAEAKAACAKALEQRPGYAAALVAEGNLYRDGGDPVAAEVCYRRALDDRPGLPGALINQAIALYQIGDLKAAETAGRAGLKGAPDDVDGLLALSEILKERGKLDEAIAALKKATAAQPDNARLLAHLFHAKAFAADWRDRDDLRARINRAVLADLEAGRKSGETPFMAAVHVADPAYNLRVAGSWAKEAVIGADSPPAPKAGDRLRIGYLTNDLFDHATSHLMRGFFQSQDRERFEVHVFSYGPDDDGRYRQDILGAIEHWHELAGASVGRMADAIRAAGIQVLIDLKGHAKGCNLDVLARRPAPVQMSWLGFPGTTGADFVDYLIADGVTVPLGDEVHCSETVIRLPDTYLATDSGQVIDDGPLTRAAVGLPEGRLVFCCFNQPYKITPTRFASWCAVLVARPDSVLWLYVTNPLAASNLKAAAKAAGIDPTRLIFASHADKPRHLARLGLADLALDTAPCNGHTTTVDALWAGLPVVSSRGSHFASRVAESLLRAAGLGELVAEDEAGYRQMILDLTDDPGRLADLKRRVAEAKVSAPLFQTTRFTRNLEAAVLEAWGHRQFR